MTTIGAMIRRDVPPGDVVRHARAVAAGFDELWIVEDLPYAGGISQLTAVLEATADHGTVVGHGIAPAPFRNPAALAMEWATIAHLYPGRLEAGIGHGLPTWMAQIGERVGSPLTLLRETVEATQTLLAGGSVQMDGRYVRIDDVTLQFPPADVPRVSAGVTGPKSLFLAGEVAGGTVLSEGFGPEQIEAARARIDAGRAAAGRDDDHRFTVFCGLYCGDLAQLGPPPTDGPDDGWAVVEPTPEPAIAALQDCIDAGADALIIVPFGPDPEQQLLSAAEHIVPALR